MSAPARNRGRHTAFHTGLALALLFAAALAIPAAAPAPSGISSDPALKKTIEERGRRFAQAVDSADAGFRTRIVREIYAPPALQAGGEARLLGLLDRLHETLGRLAFHHAEVVEIGAEGARLVALHVFAKSAKDGRWRDLQFRLEPGPPYRLASLIFVAEVAEPAYLPNGAITEPATRAWLDRYVDKLVAEEDLAGALVIAAGDRVLVERYFGHADSAQRRPIGPRTRFNLASGGKMFTALAVARLVEQGRLRFGDTLARVLPAVADRDFARGVTIAHLLSHTSGIGEFWTDEYERHWHEIRTLQGFLPFVLKAGTRFAPGERCEYSNSNYILAGLVLEAVTGKRYEEVLAEQILNPIEMRSSGLFPFDDADTLQAERLTRGPTGWRRASHGYRGSSAGGCLSTTGDMLRFGRALAAGRIVSDSMRAAMTTPRTEGIPGDGTSYGYGFILESGGGTRSYGHGGIARGVNFEFRYFPAGDILLLAFSNQDNGAYDDLRRNATKLITGER
jgi:CubicO group peptidase (beta-lactamase class C family)